jgi:hypothetical protein
MYVSSRLAEVEVAHLCRGLTLVKIPTVPVEKEKGIVTAMLNVSSG